MTLVSPVTLVPAGGFIILIALALAMIIAITSQLVGKEAQLEVGSLRPRLRRLCVPSPPLERLERALVGGLSALCLGGRGGGGGLIESGLGFMRALAAVHVGLGAVGGFRGGSGRERFGIGREPRVRGASASRGRARRCGLRG